MSGRSKILLLIAFLLTGAAILIKAVMGIWLNLNSLLAGLAGAAFVLAIVFDYRLYKDFFTMRTTKHGMNMGVTIVFAFVLIVCVNYLANRHNKTWDLTEEKLNSLSEQSVGILKGLKDDILFKVFFKGPQAAEDRGRVKSILTNYEDLSSKVHVQYVNAYVDNQAAVEYLKDIPENDKSPVVVFLERNGKRIRVEPPYDEASVTSALIKATRENEAKVYILQGHGEKLVDSEEDSGLKELVRSLEEASFKVETLNLIDRKEVPKDAALVAILGPTVPYLDQEMKWLREYAQSGGKLFIALDPGSRQNLANLTKSLGVQFENNYVFNQTSMIEGGGPATVLGRSFDQNSEITRSFPSGSVFSVFPLVSELNPASDKAPDVQVAEIVKSDSQSFTVTDPTKPLTAPPKFKNVTLGVSSKGPKFEAVIFGDSDFLANRGLMLGVNRDLALNAIAKLAQQKDLISIRPKIPKGSIVTLTSAQRLSAVMAGLSLPVVLLILSGVIWFRRRGA